MPTDEFLTQYAETGDEAAFRKLAERYSGNRLFLRVQHTSSTNVTWHLKWDPYVYQQAQT